MKKTYHITYALKDGKIANINEVERGLKCGCVCPYCRRPLIAKKGSQVIHHFAHAASEMCEHGYESSLHLAAKMILLEAKRFVIPRGVIDLFELPSYKSKLREINEFSRKEIAFEPIEIAVDRVELEYRFDEIIPDIIIYSGEKILAVEIYVTHKINDLKKKIIQEANISTIEIDLSHIQQDISEEKLKRILIEDSEEKKWIYNSVVQSYMNVFWKFVETKPVIVRKSKNFYRSWNNQIYHVDNCPLEFKIYYNGISFANVESDCHKCRYCIGINYDRKYEPTCVFCSGKHKLQSLTDLKRYLQEQQQKASSS